MPPSRWTAAERDPAPRADGPALQTTSVEAIAISSQKMNTVSRSPAKSKRCNASCDCFTHYNQCKAVCRSSCSHQAKHRQAAAPPEYRHPLGGAILIERCHQPSQKGGGCCDRGGETVARGLIYRVVLIHHYADDRGDPDDHGG